MVRIISLILIFFFIGCEMNSKQIIKPEKFTYDTIKFDAVSKKLENSFKTNSSDNEIMSEIINYWFDNRIKTDGFDGNLSVNVKQTQFEREKKQDYYKFSVSLSLEFIETKSSTNIKTYNVKSNEYGEISGSFAIKDQDNLDINLMHKALESISSKLKEIN
ncbi:hypothetical protein HIMB59_00000960 [alpha proteobacterium HIMB59]|nr:hypothetical protein HIMB59_00000960 [alpha proteobacterium HIMB59]|tara:strand:+ start:59 stop:541 length:483 start_codon:yes stop_codon:yes gene_type:complete